MNTFSTNSFAGGMNDWIHPSLLDANIATKLLNGEVSNGKLVPVHRSTWLGGTPESYGHYGTKDRSVVKYNGRYYWSNNNASSAPYYGGNPEDFLGVPYPSYSSYEAGTNSVFIDLTTASETESKRLTGEFKYCVTYVTGNGWEGAPGSLDSYEVEATITAKNPTVTVSWEDGHDISYAKIYRTTDHGADFYEIGTITTNGGTFLDEVPDDTAELNNPLKTTDYYPPPDGGKYLCEANSVFFLAKDALLYYSVQGNPHAWPTVQFLVFDDVITGIAPEFQGVLVFTRNSVFRVINADDPEIVQKFYIPGNHGCLSWRSIAVLNNAPVWLSNDGICLWDGNSIAVPSYRVLKTEGLLESVKWAVTANDRYYLFLRNEAIVYDVRNGGIFYKLGFSFEYAWYDVSSGILYAYNPNGVYKFSAGDNLSMTYSSPYIGGNESSMKVFYEAYFVNDGQCSVNIFIDGVPLLENLSLPAGRNRVKLPRNAVGRYMYLTLTSENSINEIQVLYA